jgi:hypothetical protein
MDFNQLSKVSLDAFENAMKPVYELTSSIRMNLAKHEIQGKRKHKKHSIKT